MSGSVGGCFFLVRAAAEEEEERGAFVILLVGVGPKARVCWARWEAVVEGLRRVGGIVGEVGGFGVGWVGFMAVRTVVGVGVGVGLLRVRVLVGGWV